MTTSTVPRSYSIKEAAALTGLPASTLRYYESIGVIAPISRGASSKHRVYDQDDLDQRMGVACLAATGMSVSDMRQYVANGQLGPSAAGEAGPPSEAPRGRLRWRRSAGQPGIRVIPVHADMVRALSGIALRTDSSLPKDCPSVAVL